MKYTVTALLSILVFYIVVALLVAVVVIFLGGAWDVALKVGFMIPFKWMGIK